MNHMKKALLIRHTLRDCLLSMEGGLQSEPRVPAFLKAVGLEKQASAQPGLERVHQKPVSLQELPRGLNGSAWTGVEGDPAAGQTEASG